MPKSRSRSKSKQQRAPSKAAPPLRFGGRYSPARRRRNYAILGAVGLVAAVAVGIYAWRSLEASSSFAALAAEGRSALADVETEFSRGRNHLPPGQSTAYASSFPLSGPHHRLPVRPGFYDQPQQPTRLVHAIEHGHVAIYYDQPDDAVLEQLKAWAGLYTGAWDGVIVTPMRGLGEGVVLTAWTRRLALDRFDAAAAAAFVDAYRGRGPENRVR